MTDPTPRQLTKESIKIVTDFTRGNMSMTWIDLEGLCGLAIDIQSLERERCAGMAEEMRGDPDKAKTSESRMVISCINIVLDSVALSIRKP